MKSVLYGAGASPLMTNAIFNIYCLVVMAALGISAIRQKPLGKVLKYAGCIAVGGFAFFSFYPRLSVLNLIYLIIVVIAFNLYDKGAMNGGIFNIKDTRSEAAKVQAQYEKQIAIFDQQLRDGILTQAEYDQIMSTRKSS